MSTLWLRQIGVTVLLLLALLVVSSSGLAGDGSPALLVAYGVNREENMNEVVLNLGSVASPPRVVPSAPFSSDGGGSLRLLLGHDIAKVASNFGAGAVVTTEGKLITFGVASLTGSGSDFNTSIDANIIDLGTSAKAVHVDVADLSTVVLLDDGTVRAFGWNHLWNSSITTAVIGSFDPYNVALTPVPISFDSALTPTTGNSRVKDMACGSSICAAISEDGSQLAYWGIPNTTFGTTYPAALANLSQVDATCYPLKGITAAQALFFVSCVNRSIVPVGLNYHNDFGLADVPEAKYDPVPRIIPNLVLTRLSCGDFHCIGRNLAGNLVGWGDTTYGSLGNASAAPGVQSLTFLDADGQPLDVKDFLCVQWQTFVLDSQNRIWTMGRSLIDSAFNSSRLTLLDAIIDLPPLYEVRSFDQTLSTAGLVFFVATPPPESPAACAGAHPTGNFTCINGVWTAYQFVAPEGGIVTVTEPILILGDLGISNSTTLVVSGSYIGSATPLINTTGCANINGTIRIDLTPDQTSTLTNGSRLAVLSSARCGTVTSSTIATTYTDPCKDISAQGESSESGDRKTLTVIFQLGENKCKNPAAAPSSKSSSNTWWIILVSVLGGVILILIVFVLLATFNSTVKGAVRPFWLRKHSKVHSV